MAVTEQVVLNSFANSVDEAIKSVGGDTSSVQNLCDYSKIIREQLVASGVEVGLTEGDGIVITKDGTNYTISANSGAVTTDILTSGEHVIPKATSIQKVFETMFKDILPTLPSVISGDIVVTDGEGKNQYQHPNGDPDIIRIKKGLTPDAPYLRLFLVSQEEPIYVSLAGLKTGIDDAPADGKIYGRQNEGWVEIPSSIADVTQLQSDVTKLKSDTTKLDARVTVNETNITKLQEKVTTLNDTVNTVSGSLACINSSVSDINLEIKSLKAKDEELSGAIDTTNTKLNNTMKVVAENQKNITELQTTDEQVLADIATIQNTIKDLQSGGMCVTTSPLSPPHPIDDDIPTGTKFQEVFEKLFDDILPAMPSVLKGDIITSDKNGKDIYQHPHYQETKTKSGLDPNNQYIRIFVNSQEEPVYISCEPLNTGGGGGISPDDILTESEAEKLFDEVFN